MKSKSVDTITNNEQYVRLKIFDGDLELSEAGEELLRLERAHRMAERRELLDCISRLESCLRLFRNNDPLREKANQCM